MPKLADKGIDPARLRLEWISATEGKNFQQVIQEMAEEIGGEKGKRVKRLGGKGERAKRRKGKVQIWKIRFALMEKPGGHMPFVNIKITKDGATPEQKAELIKGVTDLLVKVLHKNPATTVVVIDEVETDNWGIGGETVTARRREKASSLRCVLRTRKWRVERVPTAAQARRLCHQILYLWRES